jgi:pyrroloquinoline quinone (PQQ) biosynthesis protein C
MTFHDTLVAATRRDSDELLQIPFVRAAVRGALTREEYLAFLAQAYHHVRHTQPLLMAVGASLPERLAWLRGAIAHYIAEEDGHEQWILDDIRAAGGDATAVRDGRPDLPCELMVAYAWDTVRRGPLPGFFGMVHVLEGTSVKAATRAAAALQRSLGLPDAAFTYLTSHGALDIDHVAFFKGLMDRLDDPSDQRDVLHAAHVFFRLYGDIFRALPARAETPAEPVPCN